MNQAVARKHPAQRHSADRPDRRADHPDDQPLQGLIIGVVGTTVGAIGGVSLCWVLTRYRLIHIPQDVYQVSYIPFVVLPRDFIFVVVASTAIAFLATLYPSRQAARLDPIQALRFE